MRRHTGSVPAAARLGAVEAVVAGAQVLAILDVAAVRALIAAPLSARLTGWRAVPGAPCRADPGPAGVPGRAVRAVFAGRALDDHGLTAGACAGVADADSAGIADGGRAVEASTLADPTDAGLVELAEIARLAGEAVEHRQGDTDPAGGGIAEALCARAVQGGAALRWSAADPGAAGLVHGAGVGVLAGRTVVDDGGDARAGARIAARSMAGIGDGGAVPRCPLTGPVACAAARLGAEVQVVAGRAGSDGQREARSGGGIALPRGTRTVERATVQPRADTKTGSASLVLRAGLPVVTALVFSNGRRHAAAGLDLTDPLGAGGVQRGAVDRLAGTVPRDAGVVHRAGRAVVAGLALGRLDDAAATVRVTVAHEALAIEGRAVRDGPEARPAYAGVEARAEIPVRAGELVGSRHGSAPAIDPVADAHDTGAIEGRAVDRSTDAGALGAGVDGGAGIPVIAALSEGDGLGSAGAGLGVAGDGLAVRRSRVADDDLPHAEPAFAAVGRGARAAVVAPGALAPVFAHTLAAVGPASADMAGVVEVRAVPGRARAGGVGTGLALRTGIGVVTGDAVRPPDELAETGSGFAAAHAADPVQRRAVEPGTSTVPPVADVVLRAGVGVITGEPIGRAAAFDAASEGADIARADVVVLAVAIGDAVPTVRVLEIDAAIAVVVEAVGAVDLVDAQTNGRSETEAGLSITGVGGAGVAVVARHRRALASAVGAAVDLGAGVEVITGLTRGQPDDLALTILWAALRDLTGVRVRGADQGATGADPEFTGVFPGAGAPVIAWRALRLAGCGALAALGIALADGAGVVEVAAVRHAALTAAQPADVLRRAGVVVVTHRSASDRGDRAAPERRITDPESAGAVEEAAVRRRAAAQAACAHADPYAGVEATAGRVVGASDGDAASRGRVAEAHETRTAERGAVERGPATEAALAAIV